jgi:uncharacterized protein YpmB
MTKKDSKTIITLISIIIIIALVLSLLIYTKIIEPKHLLILVA